MKIRIDPELRRLLRPLPQSKYESMKDSIKKHGVFHPIVVSKQGHILDGYHRFKACKELGIEPPCVVKEFPDELSEKLFILDSHIERRHLNDFELVELTKPLIEIEKERAKQRQEKSLPKKGQKGFQPVMSANTLDHIAGKTYEKVAAKLGISDEHLRRSLKIIEEAPEELRRDVREGKISISRAYNKITQKKMWIEAKKENEDVSRSP